MNRKELNEEFLTELHRWEVETSTTKGDEYANKEDALDNFKSAAKELGLDPLKVCAVFLHKHYRAVMSYARLGHTLSTESIRSRIGDLRLFAALFLAIAEEELNEHN